MKAEYDFSKGQRGAVISPKPESAGKTRIIILLDEGILDYFLEKATDAGGKTDYQTLINQALREFVDGNAPRIEDTLRRLIREELKLEESKRKEPAA